MAYIGGLFFAKMGWGFSKLFSSRVGGSELQIRPPLTEPQIRKTWKFLFQSPKIPFLTPGWDPF